MVPVSMTLSELWPGFQGHNIFWSRMSEKRCVLKTKLLLHMRKLYVTYGMVVCLVALTDLWVMVYFRYYRNDVVFAFPGAAQH